MGLYYNQFFISKYKAYTLKSIASKLNLYLSHVESNPVNCLNFNLNFIEPKSNIAISDANNNICL